MQAYTIISVTPKFCTKNIIYLTSCVSFLGKLRNVRYSLSILAHSLRLCL
jgi:hypothetical protein